MKKVDEKVDMGNFTTICVDEVGELVVEFDDGDLYFEVTLTAREVYEHLKEFFDE